MGKEEKIISQLPYKLKKNLDADEIINFYKKRKKLAVAALIFVACFSVLSFILLILEDFNKLSNFLLLISLSLNFLVFLNFYKQYNFGKEKILEAVNRHKDSQ